MILPGTQRVVLLSCEDVDTYGKAPMDINYMDWCIACDAFPLTMRVHLTQENVTQAILWDARDELYDPA